MSDDEIFDVIVIGGGISGLYAAYRIQQKAPQLKVLVLEAKGKEIVSIERFYRSMSHFRSCWRSNIDSGLKNESRW